MNTKAILVSGVLLLAVMLVSCGGAGDTTTTAPGPGGTASGGPNSTSGPTSGVLAAPGLYDLEDGTVQALGILSYRDLEGGFWAVVDATLPEKADTSAVLAVIEPSADIAGSMESYRGEYVSVIGREEDVSSYQAGPLLKAESIELVRETHVE